MTNKEHSVLEILFIDTSGGKMWPLSILEITEIIHVAKPSSLAETTLLFGATTDSRSIKKNDLFIAIQGEQFDGHNFVEQALTQGALCALVSTSWLQSCSLKKELKELCLAVADPQESFRTLASFFRKRFSFPVIGIGGSNGKTTTKEMLTSLLSGDLFKVTKTYKSENGYLGLPITLTQREHSLNATPHALVLEIGIDEVGAMEQHLSLGTPDIVLLTALGPEHLTGLKNWETAAKEELLLFQSPLQKNSKRIWQLFDAKIAETFIQQFKENKQNFSQDTLVIHKEHEKQFTNELGLKSLQELLPHVQNILLWEVKELTSTYSTVLLMSLRENEKTHLFKIPLPGLHNCANFALACSTALCLQRTWREIEEGFRSFVQPPMRSTITSLGEGTVLFNDCYNASPLSMKVALEALDAQEWRDKNKILILGDMLDLGSESKHWHENLSQQLLKFKKATLFLYGNAMYDCYQKLKEQEKELAHNYTRVSYFKPETNPEELLGHKDVDFKNAIILVKGSRGMRLERFVKKFEETFSNM